jgi:hypothetical protein
MIIYHTSGDRTPFTYLIGWSKHKKYYYGRRTAKNCHPSELWTKYFTSSKHVKIFREKYGEPDIVEVRKIFTSIKQCSRWEERVLAKMDVKNNPLWLNLTGNYAFYGVIQPWNVGIPHSSRTKEKIGTKNFGKKYSSEVNSKKGRSGEKNSMYGVRRFGKEAPHYGKPHSDDTIEMLKDLAKKNRENKVTCPYCDKVGDRQNMARWHFDACKLSPNYEKKITWGRVCRLSDKKEMDPGNWTIYVNSLILE